MSRWFLCALVPALAQLTLAGAATAAAPPADTGDIQRMSIQDLVNLQVTSVSKRPEALRNSASSIYVITAEDIHRSGYVSLPEVLRLAPNLEVAKINAYAYAISARGFNSAETANKLLVLIDGRSVYEPIGSGVLWQQVDVALDNIDRIEVISGPGGVLWGANAVNGVINIITKNTAKTQGLYARVAASTSSTRSGTLRWGGKLGARVTYRVYADHYEKGETDAVEADDTYDDQFSVSHGGFAADIDADANSYTVRSDLYRNTIAEDGGVFKGDDVLTGWSRVLENGSVLSANAYVSHDVRDEPTLHESRDTYNFSLQHAIAFGRRHQFVWGLEARSWHENFVSYNEFHFANPKTTISLGSVFAQDEITLAAPVKLTLGVKVEDNSYSGADVLPSIRLAWEDGNQTLWGSVSRAVRTPNRIERELEAPVLLMPSPDFGAEKLTATELGWRMQPVSNLSFSLSAFYNQYDDLRTDGYPATIFPIVLQNGGRGETTGIEGWATWDVTPDWRLKGGFNTLHKHFELKPGFNDLTQLGVQGQDPPYQAQLHSEWTVGAVDIDIAMRTVGKVDTAPVPAYTEASTHIAWRVNDKVELALNASNLLHSRHIEVWDTALEAPRYVGRSVMLSLSYGY